MLTALGVRDFVLIHKLDIELSRGLSTFTGETGAGKSIILDALGLTIGGVAERRYVRSGASKAIVTAQFELSAQHSVWSILEESGFDCDRREALLLKRMIKREGVARAFVNDQPASANLLSKIGDILVEIHGQHAATKLMRPISHRTLLDKFSGCELLANDCRATWTVLDKAKRDRETLEIQIEEAKSAKLWLEDSVKEFEEIDPKHNEVEELSKRRTMLAQSDKLLSGISQALNLLQTGEVENIIGRASKLINEVAPLWEDGTKSALEAVERAEIETREAISSLQQLGTSVEQDAPALEAIEDRLHVLRSLARKHQVSPDTLSTHARTLRDQLALTEANDETLDAMKLAEKQAKEAWTKVAEKLTIQRKKGARKLEKAIEAELRPLKLERVKVRVRFNTLVDAGPNGFEQVEFEVETNPNTGFGPLRKVASGGELARFSLALKCALAEKEDVGVMVFDEADQGVGGAVASAVGKRLKLLAESRQVLAVTHSPQVAAAGAWQWKVSKSASKSEVQGVSVKGIKGGERQEEIARMLSGVEVTNEARAAAKRLLDDV